METLKRLIRTTCPVLENNSPFDLHERLVSGKSTGAAFIACSEMGIELPYILQNPELPIFIWQNLGNCVQGSNGLETSIIAENLSDLIIYGHYPCELLKLGIGDESALNNFSPPVVQAIKDRTTDLRSMIKRKFGESCSTDILRQAAELHTLLQIKWLLNSNLIGKLIKEGKLRLHCWILDSATNQLSCFDPQNQIFTSISNHSSSKNSA